MAKFPVLAFFCMHRNNENPAEEKSGAVAMAKSFNGQLLKFVAKNRPTIDLSRLEDQKFFSKSKRHLEQGLALLDALFSSLAEGEMIYVILDSLSSLSGSESDENKVIKALSRMIKHHRHIVIKVLVTDPLVSSSVKNVADMSLHIQDLVSGAGIIDIESRVDDITKGLRYSKKKKDSAEEKYEEGEDDNEMEDDGED